MSDPVRVLVMAPHLGPDLDWVRAIDPGTVVLDGNATFRAEVAAQGPVRARRPAQALEGPPSERDPDGPDQAERDALLSQAEVLLLGYPVPPRLADRMPRLRWVQHTQAGASNLLETDLWSSPATLTSSRGAVSTTAIAEYAIAGILYFARGVAVAARAPVDTFTGRGDYHLATVRGSTLGIVGLGGIGSEVGRLGRALGMRVVATRRSIDEPVRDADGIDLLLPAAQLHDLAAQADYLVVCAQLTPETRGMIDAGVFTAMRAGAVLVNIARGEEVDEDAMLGAIHSGRLRGALLDVYDGELAGRPPRPELLSTPAVVLTPHISAQGEVGSAPVKALFAENLRRYLAGEALLNVIDRARGY